MIQTYPFTLNEVHTSEKRLTSQVMVWRIYGEGGMTEINPDHVIIQVRKWEKGWDFMDFFSNTVLKLGLG